MILYIIIFIIGDNYMSLYAIHEEIFPTEEQEKQIWQFFGACRFIYNYMLKRNKKIYARRKEKTMSYNKMQNLVLMLVLYNIVVETYQMLIINFLLNKQKNQNINHENLLIKVIQLMG